MTEFDLEHIFTYHPTAAKIPNFNAIRDAANAAIALSGRLRK